MDDAEPPSDPVGAGDEQWIALRGPARASASARQRLVRIGVAAVVLIVAVIVLRDKVPSPALVLAALRKANWWWVFAAMALQVASLALQIRQQRRLLRAFGVVVSLPRVGAITYSSTALSMSMPVGGAVSAGYTYRQYRANGATAATAATVLLLSGLASIIALAALGLAGMGASWVRHAFKLRHERMWDLAAVAVALGAIVEIVVLLLRWWGHRQRADAATRGRLVQAGQRHRRLQAILAQLSLTGYQATHLPSHQWRWVLFSSAGNWALDAAYLYASCQAFAIHIGVLKLGAVYVGVQLIRQVPLTPGGIGVIEASLLAGLIAAHTANGPAAAAVLTYRLFSAWLIVPIGFVMLTLLRRLAPPEPAAIARQGFPDDVGRTPLP